MTSLPSGPVPQRGTSVSIQQAGLAQVVPIGGPNGNNAAWGTSGNQAYSEYDFHCAASDTSGQSETIRAKMPVWMGRDIYAMIQNRDYPKYEYLSDVVRDALYHRLHWLKDNNATPMMRAQMQQALHDWNLEQKIINAETAIARATNLLQRTMANLESMEKFCLWSSMAKMIDETRTDVMDWEGTLGMDINRVLDQAEQKIPAEYRIHD